jgi:uncharacterized membrane protein YhhN
MNPAWLLRAAPAVVAASAALAILGAPFALDRPALVFVFKPLTTLCIIAWAWHRTRTSSMRRWILAGLGLSLAGDVALLWPRQGFVAGLMAFLLAHLAYIRAFCVPVRFAARPAWFAAYGIVAALLLSQLWNGIAPPLRLPVLGYVACLASMAAQAAAWWRSSARAADAACARSAALGGALFMLSDALLAFNKFGQPLPLASLWILATYWAAQWCICESARPPAH